jgi:hypothetical protein
MFMKKKLLILLLGIAASVSSVKAQDYVYLIDRDTQSELEKNVENLLGEYLESHNLAQKKKTKSIIFLC